MVSLVEFHELGVAGGDVMLQVAEIGQIGVVEAVERGDVGQQPGLVPLEI